MNFKSPAAGNQSAVNLANLTSAWCWMSLKMASVAVSSGSVNVAGKCRICKLVAMDAQLSLSFRPWSGWFQVNAPDEGRRDHATTASLDYRVMEPVWSPSAR